MIDLVSEPYGRATFRNGKHGVRFFSRDWCPYANGYHDTIPNAIAWRWESGVWLSYLSDGTNLEGKLPTDGLHVGADWDIVQWEPMTPPANLEPPYC